MAKKRELAPYCWMAWVAQAGAMLAILTPSTAGLTIRMRGDLKPSWSAG
jgi:hypothetical protein